MSRKKREFQDDLPSRADPNYMRLYREKNKDRMNMLAKQWHEKTLEQNPDYYKEKYDAEKSAEYRNKNRKMYREHNWKKQGIIDFTHEQYLTELKNQNNRCMICEIEMTLPQVDHDHSTGKYRGILCKPCNFGLGTYEKYKEKFEEYLVKRY